MNKKLDFIISHIIISAFSILSVLLLHFYILQNFVLNKESYFMIIIGLVFIGSLVHFLLSNSIYKDIQKFNHDIDLLIKQTLHELNTPIATIKINTKLLKNIASDEKNQQRLQKIEFASEQLFELYEQMEYELKASIDAPSSEEFDLLSIINKSVFKHSDINKTITIITHVNESKYIKCDKFGFTKTIDNLLSNAIKYNKPYGSVTIAFKENILSISDTGNGIETKNLFSIFEQYFQENKNTKGVGLGLSIVKKFCDKNKINININSSSTGTTFYLDLCNTII